MKILKKVLYALEPIWANDKQYIIFNILFSFENIPRRLLNVLMLKYIVDAATKGGSFYSIIMNGFLFLSAELIMIIAKHSFEYLYRRPHEEKIRNNIKKEVMLNSLKYDIACFDDVEFYNSYTKTYSVLDNISFEVLSCIIGMLGAFISIITLLSYIFIIDPIIIAVSLFGSVISILSNFYISKLSYKTNEMQVEITRKIQYVQDKFFSKKSAKELKTEELKNLLFQIFDCSANKKNTIIQNNGKKMVRLKILFEAPLDISDMFMWLYIAHGIMQGLLQPGDFMSLSNAVWSMSQQIRNFFNAFPKLFEKSLYIDNIIGFNSYKSRIESGTKMIALPPAELCAHNVWFGYIHSKCIIRDVSFKVMSGQCLAIVGKNGAGKSTLVKLLLRLYDVDQGSLMLDNYDYKDYKIQELHKQFSVVFQDYQHYAFTVAENILLKKPDSRDDEQRVIQALKQVRLYAKVMMSEKGINSMVTKEFDENGIEFSVGEYQKLAIARAIVKNAPIVIMDEPSSSLDPIAERELMDLMREVFKQKIMIIVSHKLSMTKEADIILLLDDGKVREIGSHLELINKNGEYKRMWKAQAEKYIE